LATKLGTFQGPQAWNLSLPTKLEVFFYRLPRFFNDTKNHENKC
jgi:hypothetical protein